MNQQVLVIDDSAEIQSLVTVILAGEPVGVKSTTDPKHGLFLAASMHPDLILLDVDMPAMNGFEVCRTLKEDPATANIPVIFLTSMAAITQKVEGFSLGAVDYVTKPFAPGELAARVRSSLRIEHAMRSLEEKSLIDPLTGLGNRAMFAARFEAEVGLRVRLHNPLSCILLDIDHFKEINDTYGHPIGDQILQMIARIIADLCRTEDVACRFGGEEFVIIAPHTYGADAAILAERIREAIGNAAFEPDGLQMNAMLRDGIRVTASFGIAEAMGTYDRSMLQRADDAMYRAKREGRNRVSIAGPPAHRPNAAA